VSFSAGDCWTCRSQPRAGRRASRQPAERPAIDRMSKVPERATGKSLHDRLQGGSRCGRLGAGRAARAAWIGRPTKEEKEMRPKKGSSRVLERATTRAAALASIDPALDLGGGLTLAAFRDAIANTQQKLDAYNAALSAVDSAHNALVASEKALADMSERMLSGVATRYGKDSDEYEKAGGVRKSERKRPVRASKPA